MSKIYLSKNNRIHVRMKPTNICGPVFDWPHLRIIGCLATEWTFHILRGYEFISKKFSEECAFHFLTRTYGFFQSAKIFTIVDMNVAHRFSLFHNAQLPILVLGNKDLKIQAIIKDIRMNLNA